MTGTLTRRELYDLVWSKPRTVLAKELGVSDVWIGKQCRALNVPAPPPGYWASLAAGGRLKAKYLQPPLAYTIAERMREDHAGPAAALQGFDPRDLTRPLPAAPLFAETAEASVARYAGLARTHATARRSSGHHPVVHRLLAEDERRAAEASGYSWRQPLYRGPEGEAILRAFDTVAWHWTSLGFKVWASRGHDVVLFVGYDGDSVRFDVRATPVDDTQRRSGRPPASSGLQFWFDRQQDARRAPGQPLAVFRAIDAKTVDTLTEWLIGRWERGFREGLQWRYRRAVEFREWAIREAEEKARREREQSETAARALMERRQRLLVRAVDRIRRADEIRGLVDAMAARLSGRAGIDASFERWKTWALTQADVMDLRMQPASEMARWLEGFELQANAGP